MDDDCMVQQSFGVGKFVFIDVETTGLDHRKGHRIIEIGAVAMKNNQIEAEYQSLIHVDVAIPRYVSKVHGITNEMLTDQPKPENVFPELKEFLADSILIAHNAKFDMGFLRSEFNRLKLSLNNRTFCTLEMCRRQYPRLPNYKLETIYRYLVGPNGDGMRKPAGSGGVGTCYGSLKGSERVPGSQQHRALADARMVAAIWMEMERK
ncbi:MAG TPA: 3'-5' exonuclease [Smithellaceae bacterium]|nr:3'-5' exonuclease [Smithellaceae bacterium]